MDKTNELIEKIKEYENLEGYLGYKIIETNTIKTGAWTLLKCKYGCNNYGKDLCCPPYSPTAKEMDYVLKDYSRAILFRSKDNFPSLNKIAIALEYKALELGFYKAFALGAGRCRYCETCNLEKCSNPKIARPSMESSGIDVQITVENHGYEMLGFEDGKKIYYCYSMVLLD